MSKNVDKILKIFFTDWVNLHDASKQYASLNKDQHNNRTVAFYLHRFKRLGWIKTETKPMFYYRQAKYQKNKQFVKVKDNKEMYLLKPNFYYDWKKLEEMDINISPNLKSFLDLFFEHHLMREYVIDGNENIIKRIDNILFFIYFLSCQDKDISKQFKKKYGFTLKEPAKGYSWKKALEDNVGSIEKHFHNKKRNNSASWAYMWIYAKVLKEQFSNKRHELKRFFEGFDDANTLVNFLK